MLRSYLATALRHLAAQKLYAAINIAGLALGLACFLLIALFVRHELGYDSFFAHADRIYRISRDYRAIDGAPDRMPASNNAPVGPALLADFAEIEQVARLFGGRALLAHDDVAFYSERFRWADASVFEIFDFEWLAGDPRTALAEPGSIVLTKQLAERYFGRENPIGRTLVAENTIPLNVTGVIADLPDNTHLSIDALASMRTLPAAALEQWNSNTDFHTYFLLREGARVESVVDRLPEFLERHVGPEAAAVSGMTVMRLRDIHNRSTRDEEWKPAGNIATVYGFAGIAVLILAIACINFMNLATARSARRAREVGIRKTLGATRAQIVVQHLGESLLTTALAMLLATGVVELVLPTYNAFLGVSLRLDYLGADGILPLLAGVTLLVGVAAGSYPALYLSAFSAERVLKGDVTRGRGGQLLRNVLVTAQFAIAIALFIGTAVIYQQTSYALNLDYGFDREQIVVVDAGARTGVGPQWPALRRELLQVPGVTAVTASHYTPFTWDDNRLRVRREGATSFGRIQYMAVEYDFFETYAIEVVAGRSFARDYATDAFSLTGPGGAYVINESAARLLGFLDDSQAVGATVELGADDAFTVRKPGPVVGVVRDTHFESVAVPVRPLIFILTPPPDMQLHPLDAASIRIAGNDLPGTLARIDGVWRTFFPERPVTRRFLSEDFDALYRAEQRRADMFTAFSALAIFVACLGLLGLTWYSIEQRTKEIGIRKVVGGTVWDVVRLFTGEFSRLVLVANVLAWPAAYLFAQRWLAGFAYRVDLDLWPFVAAAALALGIACATVGAIAARAASAKPITALRYE